MAWQIGQNFSRSSAAIENYLIFYSNALSELERNISEKDKRTKVLSLTHDWPQHNLPSNHKDRFYNNINTIVSNHSKVNPRN